MNLSLQNLGAWEREYRAKGTLWRGAGAVDALEEMLSRDARILELGCGNGKTLLHLAAKNYNIFGIDSANAALRLTRRNAREKKLDVNLARCDVISLPFRECIFDAAIANHVLDALLERERKITLAEISRVLRAGGLLFLRVFSTRDMRFALSKKMLEVEKNTFRKRAGIVQHYFEEGELRDLLRELEILKLFVERKTKLFRGKEYIREEIVALARKR